ncbi:MAG: YihY/virulence factor BrkB family protein [Marinifilaceae bacterium]
MKSIQLYFDSLMNFLSKGVWNMRLKDLSGPRYFLIRQLRIYLLAVKGFYEDKCQLRASALTFYSLLSVVPILAMAFGIAKGFGIEKLLEKELNSSLSGQQEVLQWLIGFANKMLENTKGTLVAGLGLAILFWSVMKVLGNIEASFNDVWQIKKGRTWARKFTDYLAVMILAPILMVTSSSLTVVITTHIKAFAQDSTFMGAINPFIFFLLKLVPYCLIWLLFTGIYIFMPNTRVKFKSGLMAGVIAGTIYQLLQWGYIEFQVGVSTYNAIYGSFAALPLFLVWLQFSWLIVLFGAEISFAEQNVESYEYEAETIDISYDYKRLLSLYVCHFVVDKFARGERAPRSIDISQQLEIPIRLVREIVFNLVECGIFSELRTEREKVVAYQPSMDINRLTLQYVIDTLERKGSDNIPVLQTQTYEGLNEVMKTYRSNVANQPGETLLKDL